MKKRWIRQALLGNVAAVRGDSEMATASWKSAIDRATTLGISEKKAQAWMTLKEISETPPFYMKKELFFEDDIYKCGKEGAIALWSFAKSYGGAYQRLVDDEDYEAARRVALEGLAVAAMVGGEELCDIEECLERLEEVSIALGETQNTKCLKFEYAGLIETAKGSKDKPETHDPIQPA